MDVVSFFFCAILNFFQPGVFTAGQTKGGFEPITPRGPPVCRARVRESNQVLEDEREALVSVDDVVQSHDVGVLEVL